MVNPDEFYKQIERKIVGELKSTGKTENAFWQHIGRYVNHQLPTQGSLFNEMLYNIERMMTGQKRHGFEQNKKTETEKLIEKGEQINGRD